MIPVIFFILVFSHAYFDGSQIKKGIVINHKRESIIFIIICIGLSLLLAKWFPVLPLILFPLLTRAAFFDPLLNYFIGKPLLYEGVKKAKVNESWFDRLERNIGLPTWFYRIVYWAAYITYLIIYLV